MLHRSVLSMCVGLGLVGAACAQSVERTGETTHGAPSGTLMKMDLEQLSNVPLGNVYAASKAKQKAVRAASSVTVITAQDIRKYGYRTLGDILRAVRGFYVTYDRNYTYVGVRGFGRPADYNSRLQVLLDGHRLNDPVYGAVYVDTEAVVDVDLIDRVEIVRGPSSSVYGTGAFFAVVNVITREGANMRGSELSGEAGSFRQHRGRVTLGHEDADGTRALASFTTYRREGDNHLFFPEFADAADNFGFADNADRDRFTSGFLKFEKNGFTLDAGHVLRDKVVPTASFGTAFDTNGTHTSDAFDFVRLRYERELGRHTSVMVQGYDNRSRYDADYQFDRTGNHDPTQFVDNRDTSAGNWWVGEVQVTHTFGRANRLTFGSEYQRNARQDQFNFDINPFRQNLDDRRSSYLRGIYMEGELHFTPELALIAGARNDFFSTSGSTTNPRIGVIVTPRDSTVLKLLYGTAFRAPNNFELFYADGATQKPSAGLQNETISTYEGVWEERLSDDLRATACYYYYQMYGLVDSIVDPADGLIVFTNRDTIDARGLELELSGRLPRGVEGRLSWALQRTRDLVTDATLTNSPAQQIKANVSVPFAKRRAFLSLDSQYVGPRVTNAAAKDPAYVVANFTLYAPRLVRKMDLSLSVYNAFDRHFSDLGGTEHRQDLLQQDGRTFRIKSTAHF